MTSAEIVRSLIEANLAGGAAVAMVALLRRPARRLIGAGAAYGLWLAVPLAAAATLAPSPRLQVVEMTAPVFEAVVEAPAVVAEAAAAAPMDIPFLLTLAWAVGAMVFALALMISQRRFVRSLGPIRREGRLARAQAAAGPAVVGAFWPRIVAPADFEARFDDFEREVILDHEKIHLASGHAQINALVALVQCVCWFNPLAHLAARLMRIDQELACDAAVIARHPGRRRIYAEALLKTQTTARPLPFGCYWPAGGAGPLKERIAMLKAPTPAKARRLMGAGVALGLGLAAAAGAWSAQPARTLARFMPVADVVEKLAPAAAPTSVQDLRPDAPAAAQTAGSPLDLSVVIEVDGEVVGRPRITVARGQQGVVRIGSELPLPAANGVISVAGQAFSMDVWFHDYGPDIALAQVEFMAWEVVEGRQMVGVSNITLTPGEPRTLELQTPSGKRVKVTFNPRLVPTSVSLTNADPGAGAQPAPPARPTVITRPQWGRMPSAEEMAEHWPDLAPGESGSGMLSCTVSPAGRLSGCSVESEIPAGHGIADSLLGLSELFEMNPESEGGESVGGARVRVPIRFQAMGEVSSRSPINLSTNRIDVRADGSATLTGNVSVRTSDGEIRGETVMIDSGSRQVTAIGE